MNESLMFHCKVRDIYRLLPVSAFINSFYVCEFVLCPLSVFVVNRLIN